MKKTFRLPFARLSDAVLVLLMTAGCFLCFLSAVDTTGCANAFSSPWNGLLQFENAFLQFLTRKTGRIILLFSCEQNRDYLFAVTALALVFALLFQYAVREKKIAVSCVAGLFVVAGYGFGLFHSAVGVALLILGFLLTLTERIGGKSFWVRLGAITLSFALVFTSVSALHIAAPASKLKASLGRGWHTLRYETNDPLPEGDLRRDTASAQTGQTALTVEADTLKDMVLRGFVGDTFDGVRWSPLENETLSRYTELFYWLHERGFYGTVQPMLALEVVDDCTVQTVQVTNVSACKRYAFLPTACRAESLWRASRLSETPVATGETYTAQMPTCDKAALFAAQRKIAKQDGTDNDYLQAERAYAQFVYETALTVPDSTAQALKTVVAEEIKDKGLADKLCYVLDFFHRYTHTTAAVPFEGEDAVAWFLEKSKVGNDAMFASASALMLRYLGIPARYAEGYRVESETVKRSDAHAWAEYYLDGIGWIALETLPELTQQERIIYEQASEAPPVPFDEEPLNPPDEQKVQEGNPQIVSYGTVLMLIGLSLLLAAVSIVLWRRLRFQKRLRRIHAMPPKERIPALYAYAQYVQKQGGVCVPDAEARRLRQEALFSNHTMTERHVERMEQYVTQSVTLCREKDTLPKKLRHILWDCLY